MKNIIIILITLMNFLAFSQKATVTYIASTSSYINVLKTKKNTSKYIDVIENASDIEYKLYINKNKSYYKKEESLIVEGTSVNMTSVLAGRGIFYSDLKVSKNINEIDSALGAFLIEYENINWKLTNESKKIGKYTCLKATATIKRKHRDGYREKKVTAWYTPEIPLNFGPKFYNGLPGLIISLQEGNKLYLTAKFIDLNPKEMILIPEPSKNFERITFEEFENMISKKFNSFRKNRRK